MYELYVGSLDEEETFLEILGASTPVDVNMDLLISEDEEALYAEWMQDWIDNYSADNAT